MRLKLCVWLSISFLAVCAACSASAQIAPAATGQKSFSPLAVGAGFSAYNSDFGDGSRGHLLGGTLWIEYFPNQLPAVLRGLGVEMEARDLSFGRSATLSPTVREDVATGGLIYSYPLLKNLRPYAKILVGFGNTDEQTMLSPVKWHDSRTIVAGGGGVDYRTFKNLWLRADYEYQSWPDFFKHSHGIPAGRLNPQGFTVGAVYHF